jgi:hypothetical protein
MQYTHVLRRNIYHRSTFHTWKVQLRNAYLGTDIVQDARDGLVCNDGRGVNNRRPGCHMGEGQLGQSEHGNNVGIEGKLEAFPVNLLEVVNVLSLRNGVWSRVLDIETCLYLQRVRRRFETVPTRFILLFLLITHLPSPPQ